MVAFVGDRLVIGGHRIGQPARRGMVLEVRDAEGGPPYLVQWNDTDHPTLFYPGSDCLIEHESDTDAGVSSS